MIARMATSPSGPTIRPLRVLHVAGTENGAAWMHEQVRGLRARGHDATGIISGAGGTLASRFTADHIPFEVAELDVFGGKPLDAARRVFALARVFRRLRPDVVQCHLFSSIILGRMAAWLADVPVRLSMIPGPYYLEAPGLCGIDVRTAPLDTRVIASCEYTRELYERQGVPRTQVELIYYGQDPDRFNPATADGARVRRELGIEPERPVVGDVAYFYPPSPDGPFTPPHLVDRGIKGHETLLRAVPRVLEAMPDAILLLVGEGWGPAGAAYQQQLESLAAELGVTHAVRFTGSRSDIPDTLAAFDVSVQCSLNENLGGSIESLLMARPLVASAVGGLVDAVLHERTGLLVPPGDPEALADAIVRLLQDRPLAQRLATEGRSRALSLLTLDTTVDNLEALYAREMAGRSGDGYRLWRSAWRAVWLGLNAKRLMRPLRDRLAAYQRRIVAEAARRG
jgi:glycosyltransferase involved in cell wall biosynthesis